MSDWKKVGEWLKSNAATGAPLVGNLLLGNPGPAVAKAISLIASATGQAEPDAALASLQNDPETMLNLQQLAKENEADIRRHTEAMELLRQQDLQKEHEQTQLTIRNGDNAEDQYTRQTRPILARRSFYLTAGYIFASELGHAIKPSIPRASIEVAMLLISLCWAYFGLRSVDKRPGPLLPTSKSHQQG